jgi:nucleotide-binding universal stress UspA family protein
MTWKTILVHLDDGPRCSARVALAGSLAARFGAHLLGVSPTGLIDVPLPVGAAAPDAAEVAGLSAAKLREAAHARARAFERLARELGLDSIESRVVESDTLVATAALGRRADLVVVGQTEHGAEALGVGADFPQQVALHCGGPVLVVPYAGHFASIGRDVLVAWKDVREAARALRDALPLLAGARRVVLLELVGRGASHESEALADLQARLGRLGVAAEVRREATEIDVGDALLSRAAELGVDAIVMGAYGHTRLREWVLGGMTRALLEHMTVPALMTH